MASPKETARDTEMLTVVNHPLVQHKLTLMRRKETSSNEFRTLLKEIGMLLGYEAMKDLKLELRAIETPLTKMDAPVLSGKKLCFVPILRAGEGLLTAMLDLVPSARVGHIGMYRDEATLKPVTYLNKLPKDLARRRVIALDPMLATGNSAADAVDEIKAAGAKDVRFLCLLAAPEGIGNFLDRHPDVSIVTAAVDRQLNQKAYIVPGLGDAGDRLFGTK